MGLDMYLSAQKYVSGWNHNKKDQKMFNAVLVAAEIDPKLVTQDSPSSPSLRVNFHIAYWRKANAIHSWFVTNCQDGLDECQRTSVSRDQLKALQIACEEAIKNKDATKIEPQGGFFFGSTDELKRTAKTISKILANKELEDCEFFYQSSW